MNIKVIKFVSVAGYSHHPIQQIKKWGIAKGTRDNICSSFVMCTKGPTKAQISDLYHAESCDKLDPVILEAERPKFNK